MVERLPQNVEELVADYVGEYEHKTPYCLSISLEFAIANALEAFLEQFHAHKADPEIAQKDISNDFGEYVQRSFKTGLDDADRLVRKSAVRGVAKNKRLSEKSRVSLHTNPLMQLFAMLLETMKTKSGAYAIVAIFIALLLAALLIFKVIEPVHIIDGLGSNSSHSTQVEENYIN